MATQNVCRYFKFGFCKYLERCHFQHIKEKCEKHDCDVKSCNLRHPKFAVMCSYRLFTQRIKKIPSDTSIPTHWALELKEGILKA